ncbi:SusC/RagA family TonB-linked outer membrane protein [Pedobacter jamesrossensis]|uniref:SusC/RagA family TonB-linked outer membrane protein n=1 Tax=Pedobacter jamesrossensis TaxID=1908238 RepID=A0ABV8NP92_9SPHI
MKLRYYPIIIFTAVFTFFQSDALAQVKQKGKNDSKSGLKTDSIKIMPRNVQRYIGYSRQDSVLITSAISTIKGDILTKNFNTNLGNKLYGRLAGLTVSQGGSEAGYDRPSLLSRGRNSYQGQVSQEPLVIVDGFIGSYELLVAEEIEEISLLKDASALAVYGFRGANGVLLVTTKRGKAGPLSIGFSSQLGFNRATSIPKTLNSFDYASLYNEAAANDGRPPLYDATALESYKTGNNPTLYPNINWYDEALRKTAPVSNYNLNFSGGDKTVRYFVALNAINQQGLYKNFGDDDQESSNSTYSRYNFRSNIEVNITKRFSATLLLGGNVEDKANPYQITSGGSFNAFASTPPNAFPVRIPDNSVTVTGAAIPNGSFAGTAGLTNPIANLAGTGFFEYNARTFQSNFSLRHDLDFITQGLSASASISFNNYFQGGSGKTKQVQRYIISNNSGTAVYSPAIAEPNLILSGQELYPGENRSFGIQSSLNYNRTFGIHGITGLLFYNSDSYNIIREQPTTSAANNALPYKTNGGGGRVTYVNNNKYIAEVSFGFMGSENFAKGNRYGFFPAASVGWIASNEDFLKNNRTISLLKLRGSYGLTGNDNIGGRFLFEQRYPSGASYVFGASTTVFSLTEGRLANPNITWEKEKVANIGAEIILKNQFKFSMDLFDRDRYDLLPSVNATGGASSASIPMFLGYNQFPLLNVGKVNNKGFEAVMSYNNKSSKALSFFAEANVFYAKNKIIFSDESPDLNRSTLTTGLPIGVPFGLRALGLFQNQADVDASAKPIGANVRVGDIKYADIGGPNGIPDGIIDGNDNVVVGNPGTPNLSLGFHSGLKYKGFDLDFVIQGVTGRSVFLNGSYFSQFQNANASASAIALERWTPTTAATAEFPRLSLNGNQNNYRFSSFYERDGSFIKLRSVEIGYSFKKSLLQKIKLTNGRIFINGTNLLSIDKIPYGDPESLDTGYPPLQSYSVGLRVGF